MKKQLIDSFVTDCCQLSGNSEPQQLYHQFWQWSNKQISISYRQFIRYCIKRYNLQRKRIWLKDKRKQVYVYEGISYDYSKRP